MIKKWYNFLLILILLYFMVTGFIFSQLKYVPPRTILPDKMIKLLLNELSGQLAFNNEVVLAGFNQIRTAEEFNTFFHEGSFLSKKLKDYGLDKVLLEDVGKSLAKKRGRWWIREDAELHMIEPDEKLLSRLSEHPALMARFCDPGEWEGELVYLDFRDIKKLKNIELKGKIILTPEYPSRFSEAFSKGALGVISYYDPNKNIKDPYQVMFNMSFQKGNTEQKVFCFHIWHQLGEQLREMLFRQQKVVLRAKAKTAYYPYKLDAVYACIKGTNPQKKGMMFTAHLFERPLKQGANDNASGCVTITEIARTITTLIKQGKIERPERTIHFLMSEEGSGTMCFLKEHPEIADKILTVINMDMVGEDLDKNQAFFFIEKPLYSRTSFLEPLTIHFTDYVFKTNTKRPKNDLFDLSVDFPIPILDKNGSNQPFRYILTDFLGSSDHGMFIETDSGISAVMFSVWPDRWFHTDKDRPDKTDPTQLERAAFIGAASALAISMGNEDIVKNLINLTYRNRLQFIQNTLINSIEHLSLLKKSDGGLGYADALNNIHQAVILGKQALNYLSDLTQGKRSIEVYLTNLEQSLNDLPTIYAKILKENYEFIAHLNGYQPILSIPSEQEQEKKLQNLIPIKTESIPLGQWIRFSRLNSAIRGDRKLMLKIYREYSHLYLLELFLCIDGHRNLDQIRDLLTFEFKRLPVEDFMKIINCLSEAKLIEIKKK